MTWFIIGLQVVVLLVAVDSIQCAKFMTHLFWCGQETEH